MKCSASLALGALLPLALSQRVVKYDIQGTHPSVARKRALEQSHQIKRNTLSQPLVSDQSAYYINITIGTPPQPVAVQLDTGSSNLWVLQEGIPSCQGANSSCEGGFFNPNQSSTYNLVDQGGYQSSYGTSGQNYAIGDYATDVVSIGSAQIPKQGLSVVTNTSETLGIMGVGFAIDEAACASSGDFANCNQTFPTVVDSLVNNGLISTAAYSLWLNDLNASTGSILFGGVDTSHYTGDLVSLPIVPDPRFDQVISFLVEWTNFTVSTPDGSVSNIWIEDNVYPALLDSGTTFDLWPAEVANAMFELLGAQVVMTQGQPIYIVDCALQNSNATAEFTFGGPNGATIGIPMRELVIELPDDAVFHYTNGDTVCRTSFSPASAPIDVILGDTFLRYAYVVYDLANQQIGMAQTNFNPGQSNIQEISNSTSSGGIPGVTRTASSLQLTVTETANYTYQTIATETLVTTTAPLASFITASYTGSGSNAASSAATTGSSTGAGPAASSTGTHMNAASPNLSASSQQTITVATFLTFAGILMMFL